MSESSNLGWDKMKSGEVCNTCGVGIIEPRRCPVCVTMDSKQSWLPAINLVVGENYYLRHKHCVGEHGHPFREWVNYRGTEEHDPAILVFQDWNGNMTRGLSEEYEIQPAPAPPELEEL